MECSIKEQKVQAMKNNKRANFVYNFVLYSLTSIITCFFFSYPFWFPSLMNHFLSYVPNNISVFLNPKCFFVVGNLIVLILVGESKLKQSSSSTSDTYYEYIARSQSGNHNENSKEMNGYMKSSNIYHEEEKKGMRVCKRTMLVEEKKRGMRTSKSAVWGESGIMRREKNKGKKEEFYKTSVNHDEEKKKGMRSYKSEIWGESEIMKKEKTRGKKEEFYKSSMNHEEKKKGMRSCKSEIWEESDFMKKENTKEEEEKQLYMPINDELNKRVEAFIARVNQQMLLESKLVDYDRG